MSNKRITFLRPHIHADVTYTPGRSLKLPAHIAQWLIDHHVATEATAAPADPPPLPAEPAPPVDATDTPETTGESHEH